MDTPVLTTKATSPLEIPDEKSDLGFRLLESITDGFYVLDGDWRLTYLNETARRVLAPHLSDVGSILGKVLFDSFPATRGTIIEESFQRAVNEQVMVEYEVLYEPWDQWFATRCYPVRGGGLMVYFRDITERKRATEALLASERKYQRLFNSIDEGFCVVEVIFDAHDAPSDYRFLVVNPDDRDRYVAASRDLVRRCRETDGCLDVSITADSVDPGRVNNFELWSSQETLDAFRDVADPPDTGIKVLDASMSEYIISYAREPFSID